MFIQQQPIVYHDLDFKCGSVTYSVILLKSVTSGSGTTRLTISFHQHHFLGKAYAKLRSLRPCRYLSPIPLKFEQKKRKILSMETKAVALAIRHHSCKLKPTLMEAGVIVNFCYSCLIKFYVGRFDIVNRLMLSGGGRCSVNSYQQYITTLILCVGGSHAQ